MNIKIHSSELNRIMKTVTQCIDGKNITDRSNVEIIYDNNMLSVRGTDGHFSAVMSTPLLGGDGESFCVDGAMFAKVCAMCSGEIEISTDGKICTVKGAGRTRIPIVNARIPKYERVSGTEIKVTAEDFSRCYGCVAHAVSADQTRIQLTGILVERTIDPLHNVVKMTAIDGFQLSVEEALCDGDEMKAIIPGAFMKLIVQSVSAGEKITIRTDGKRIEASTEGMLLNCGLLAGEFPPAEKIIPKEFKTKCLINAEALRSALKSGSVVNSKQNLVKLEVGETAVKVMNNSEEADYEADVACQMQGKPLKIAFNQKYLMNTINSLDTDEIVMEFGSSVSPCVMHGKEGTGERLVLPVRVQG